MKIKFDKMHGLGNDFMVIDAINQSLALTPDNVREWSDRHRGVGFDQLLLLEPPQDDSHDFFYRIYNADGHEVGQCGNGARCVAAFAVAHQLTSRRVLKIKTRTSHLQAQVTSAGMVTINFAEPVFTPAAIPFLCDQQATNYVLQLHDQELSVNVLSVGNPHCVVMVDEISMAPVLSVGQQIALHPRFPEGVNVEFMQIVSPELIRLRVLERGAGETQACGSGACAAVVAGRLRGLLAEQVTVELVGGELAIAWPGPGNEIVMTGPATRVYSGEIE